MCHQSSHKPTTETDGWAPMNVSIALRASLCHPKAHTAPRPRSRPSAHHSGGSSSISVGVAITTEGEREGHGPVGRGRPDGERLQGNKIEPINEVRRGVRAQLARDGLARVARFVAQDGVTAGEASRTSVGKLYDVKGIKRHAQVEDLWPRGPCIGALLLLLLQKIITPILGHRRR